MPLSSYSLEYNKNHLYPYFCKNFHVINAMSPLKNKSCQKRQYFPGKSLKSFLLNKKLYGKHITIVVFAKTDEKIFYREEMSNKNK